MKSPQDMRIIQIDITNACIHRCSNCTRFCGHHKKPFFMNWETFKKAADSFEGYRGTVGIMGGEPTLHPEFERFVNYIKEHPYYPKTETHLVRPVKRFMDMIAKMEQRDTFINREHGINRRCVLGYGLWSALSEKYRDYYELIQDTFNFQALNDHTNIMYHSPIMIRRKDLHIPDEEWYPIRDNCWAQGEWSATITPKGAFFCEIAGALDMLFDGPGGWPIEPGWWRRQPEEFGEQLKWCELCGIAIHTFTRDANEEIDDMSAWYLEELKKIESPKVRQGLHNVVEIDEQGNISEKSKKGARQVREYSYSDSYFSRFNEKNDWLNPKGFVAVLIIVDQENENTYVDVIKNNAHFVDEMVIVVNEPERGLATAVRDYEHVKVIKSHGKRWGDFLNKALQEVPKDKYVVLMNEHTQLEKEFKSFLKSYVLNPGSYLYSAENSEIVRSVGENIDGIFSPAAAALRRATYPVIARLENHSELRKLWEEKKIIPLSEDCFKDYEYKIEPGIKYAMYGLGDRAEKIYGEFAEGQVVCVADSNPQKQGKDFWGHRIIGPEELCRRKDEFDKVFVSSRAFFDIKTDLMEMGFAADRIVTTLMVL